jgi:hypothetical protein
LVTRQRNLAEFRRSDYLGNPDVPLSRTVRERVRAETRQARRAVRSRLF